MIPALIARIIVSRHVRKGHRVVSVPDLYGIGRVKFAYYCSCGKEWVG